MGVYEGATCWNAGPYQALLLLPLMGVATGDGM